MVRCRRRDEIWDEGDRGARVRAAGWPRRKEKSDKPAKMRYYSRTERQNAAKPMKMTAEMRTEGEKLCSRFVFKKR